MHFEREAKSTVSEALKGYSVVTLVGPRQVGKTTLIREMLPHKPYSNLEDPDVRAFALEDPKRFLEQFPTGGIIDEIQYAPQLLSYIQVQVDEHRRRGEFVLTGSQQIDLNEAVSQSLAGRTAIISLLPLSFSELEKSGVNLDLETYLVKGFMPGFYEHSLEHRSAYRNYVSTYLERDVRKITKVHDLSLFQKFLKLCASRVGSMINYENLGNEVGVSATTIRHWFSILEASYLIFRIQPYFENFGKRVIKSTKLYFFDVGLVSYLLDIETKEQMLRDPLRGNLVENLVVLELIKARMNRGLAPNLYYYRDNHGNEVDLIFKRGNELIPIEIKSAKTVVPEFLKGLKYLKHLSPERVTEGYLIYAGLQEYTVESFELLNYQNARRIVENAEGA